MKKLSVIRGGTISKCPYGLDIISSCNDVGSVIKEMTPIDNLTGAQAFNTAKNNRVTYHTQKVGERCPFANEIMEKFNKVDCSYGDTAAGEGTGFLPSSPLYPRNFIGDGLEPGTTNKGQDIYDPRQYYDAPERGIDVPFGLFSIFSHRSNEQGIIRIAGKYTNKFPNIKDKLALLRDKYYNTLKTIISNSSVIKLSDEHLEKLLFVIEDWTK